MSKEALRDLGLDPERLGWQDLAVCKGMDTRLFFDEYESSTEVANLMDQACLSCLVRPQCLREGVENSEWGLWGGVFLVSGKADQKKNSHKTQEVWAEISKGIEA